jgi:hypothetical protein
VRPSWAGINDEGEDMQSPTRRRRVEGGAAVKIK